jgi:hypothetical protein
MSRSRLMQPASAAVFSAEGLARQGEPASRGASAWSTFSEGSQEQTKPKKPTMKKPTIITAALALLSVGAFAGDTGGKAVVTPAPAPEPEVFYNANEFSVGLSALLGARNSIDSRLNARLDSRAAWGNTTQWGADLETRFFFTRNFGVGLEGEYIDINRPLFGSALNFYLRAPLNQTSRWAPYIFGGAGGLYAVGQARFEGHAGAGLEFRITPKIGIFGDGRYVWVDGNHNDIPQFGLFRLGFNFVF